MVGWWILVMILLISSQRISELYIAHRNTTWALAAGAQEFGAWHYPLFFLLHSGWLLGFFIEFHLNGSLVSEFWYVWLSLFMVGQGLRYWCMISLGRLWNTRILVIPGAQVIVKGPYRYIKHPNYVAVAIELISVPMMFGAIITAITITVLNAILILAIRIPEEERALGLLRSV